MRVLFVIRIPYAIEPHGVMLLAAIAKKAGHQVGLTILAKESLAKAAESFKPDVVAYSVIGSEIEAFQKADNELKQWMRARGQHIFRIMGGPHPTFAPTILDTMELDAICQGDGEKAFPEMLRRLEAGESIADVPNIAVTSAGALKRELIIDQDAYPFADRDLYYKAVPYLPHTGLRSFITGRGCPFSCAYCYNHAYNNMFNGCGPIMRRRSVEHVLAEVDEVVKRYQPVRFIRFFDDIFALKADEWLQEFSEKYASRFRIPFYCLMRPNTFTEDTAKLLSDAGCYSISMAIEAGTERIRREILGRKLSNDDMIRAFDLARKYKLRTYGNTMVAIPGTTLEDDFVSLDFTRSLSLSVPTFSVCSPSRGTKLAQIAEENNYLEPDADLITRFGGLSPLNCFTHEEKEIQARIACLGTMYCTVPKFLAPAVKRLIRSRLPLGIAKKLGFSFTVFRIATRLFPHAIPRSPLTMLKVAIDGIRYFW